MFPDLSWSHMLLVLVVALVVVGPKDLPKVMRKLGQWTAKARDMADQFRRSFDEMARQSELDELRKEIEELRNTRPLAEAEAKFNEAVKVPDVSVASDTDAVAAPDEPEDRTQDVADAPDWEDLQPGTEEPKSPHEGGMTPPAP